MRQQCNSIRRRPETIDLTNTMEGTETRLIKVGRQGWYDLSERIQKIILRNPSIKPARRELKIYENSARRKRCLATDGLHASSR